MIKTDPSDLLTNRLFRQSEVLSKHVASSLKLEKNEVVQAKVLNLLSQNRALLLIKGQQVVAKIHIPLQEGRTFSLIANSVSPLLSFKPLGPLNFHILSPNISLVLSAIKENIWGSIIEKLNPLVLSKKTISQLSALLKELTLEPFSRITPEFLKRLIEKSGLGWEAKLRKALRRKTLRPNDIRQLVAGDLKGLASKLMVSEKENKPLEQLISVLKHIQLLNQKDQCPGKKYFIPIPVQYTEGGFTVARLVIQLPGKGAGETGKPRHDKHPMRISLHLELSYLGPIYADLCLTGKTVTGKFLLNKKEARVLVEERMPMLVDRLKENGYNTASMMCSLADANFIEQTLMADVVHPEDTLLNLVI